MRNLHQREPQMSMLEIAWRAFVAAMLAIAVFSIAQEIHEYLTWVDVCQDTGALYDRRIGYCWQNLYEFERS